MRPLELTVEGFRSYGRRTTFDWRGRRLVAVVGSIGSGKSTLLDAMAFALYGKTPTVGRDTRSLINQRASDGKVELRFQVDGQVWKAVRALRRTGQSQHALYRLEADEAAAEALDTVTLERDVNEQVERLLGLDFDAFSRSVLLAQNQFHRFLSASTGERDKVLKGLFGLDVLDDAHEVAKRRREGVARDLADLRRRLETVEEAKERLGRAERREAAAASHVKRLDDVAPRVRELESDRREAERRRDEHARHLRQLREMAERLPRREDADEVLKRAEDAAAERERLQKSLDAAREKRAEARRALDETIERTGGRDLLARARWLLDQLEQQMQAVEQRRVAVEKGRREARDAVNEVEARYAELVEAHRKEADAAGTLQRAEEELAHARRLLDDARHREMAFSLREALVPGESCPVCEQPVSSIPPASGSTGLEERQAEVSIAVRREAAARRSHAEAAQEVASAKERLKGCEKARARAERTLNEREDELREATTAVARARRELEALVGDGDASSVIDERELALIAAEQEFRKSERAADEAREANEKTRSEAQSRDEDLHALVTRLAEVAGRLGHRVEVTRDPAALRTLMERLDRLWRERFHETQKARDDDSVRLEEATTALAHVMLELGEQPDADFAAVRARAAQELGAAGQEVEELRRQVADEKNVRSQIEKTTSRVETYDTLAEDLTPRRFLRYLLEEERGGLAALGSEHFERLSGGRYRFTQDGSFSVVDRTAGDAVRKPESLSGGETFLASLALALSLAEMVSRGHGRLQAFFLDEGFGSLDPEHLDLAMEGIESLVTEAEDRLVVLVSHTPEVRERVEDLVQLTKDALTADTVVVSGARPS